MSIMNKSTLKDTIDKNRKEMIIEARKILKRITESAIKWYDDVDKAGDINSNEVIAGNIKCIRELTSVIVSLDARLQVLEDETLFKHGKF